MKKHLLGAFFVMMATTALSQTVTNDADGLFDSTSYVETDSTTNNTNTSTVTTNNTNTNTSTVTSTNTNNNTNTNTSTVNSTSTVNQNTNSTVNQTVNSTSNITTNNTNTSTSTNTNTNTNNTTIDSTATNTNNNTNTNNSTINQKVETPPPSAIAPSIQSGGNDTCTVSYSAAVQTQILGMSGGGHIRDLNCERLKNAKTLYNMGMKVAAVALMCQEETVFKAMEMAGTPCPYKGEIGTTAQALWDNDPERKPVDDGKEKNDATTVITIGGILLGLLLLL